MSIKYKGLNSSEVIGSRTKNGSNSLRKIKTKSLPRRFFENLSDPIIKILLFALLLQIVFTFGNCNFLEIFGIVAAILISTTVSTISEYGSEKAFMRMEEEAAESRARVIRDGVLCEIPSTDIVVGDIVILSSAESVQADGILIDGEISVDQSALNGENIEVAKHKGRLTDWDLNSPSCVFRGSIVTSGNGVMRVMRVGESTYYGKIAGDVQAQTRISPLKLRLSRLAQQISILGYICAFFVGFTYIFNALVVDNGFVPSLILSSLRDYKTLFPLLIRAFTMMITVVVVAVPEGLPMMITVVLSANMRRMLKDKILIKKLVGIETSGSLNILFTDKTGTLTTGKMSLERVITEEGSYKTLSALRSTGNIYEKLLLCAKYNTDSRCESGEIIGGNSTERAIAEFFSSVEAPTVRKIDYTPFTSERKCSTVLIDDSTYIVKGAPELILSRTHSYVNKNGDSVTSDFKGIYREYREALANGQRVIAVAVGTQGGTLSLLCLLVLKDKIRPGVKDAIRLVENAGIQLVMLTGDNIKTAESIACECGFYDNAHSDIALTSEELNKLSDDEVKAILPRLRVLARALPSDKTRLVRLSQELGKVVGMTGDGINDAPSLKLADVGFSMGSGTDIAKSAGDIVILDDSFFAISKAILYGRTIFKSIRKFITFQLIMNLAACGITLLGQFMGIDNPITIIQMLWINIIMDTLGGIAFAGEAPEKYYMKEKPKKREEPILSRASISHIIFNGAYTLLILVLFLRLDYFRHFFGTGERLLSAFYALFIFAGLFNCLSARSERMWIFAGIGKNKLFIYIMLFISAIQLLIVYFGGTVFRSTPLSLPELTLTIAVASTVLLFDGFRRILSR